MDFFNSFFQNAKEKLSNPFFGTLGLILIIHHWEFWYTLFNIGEVKGLEIRIATLRAIGKIEFTGSTIARDVIWTFVIMIIGYLIIVGTRSLALFIDFGLMPGITKRVINKNVIARNEYEEVLTERNEYSAKYEEERKAGRLLSKSYDEQLAEIIVKNGQIRQINDQVSALNEKIKEVNDSLTFKNSVELKLNEKLINITDEKSNLEKRIVSLEADNKALYSDRNFIQQLLFNDESRTYWASIAVLPPLVEKLVQTLKFDGFWNGFLNVVEYERHGGTIGTEIYSQLKPYGVLTDDDSERLNVVGRFLADNAERFKTKRNGLIH
nr:hypothetical protein [uncultured Mucilaginibacter sp.]